MQELIAIKLKTRGDSWTAYCYQGKDTGELQHSAQRAVSDIEIFSLDISQCANYFFCCVFCLWFLWQYDIVQTGIPALVSQYDLKIHLVQ